MTARRFLRLAALQLVLAVGYMALAQMATMLPRQTASFWPPAALGAFAAMLWGRRALPGMFAGALWVGLQEFGWSPAGALVFAVGGALAPLLGAWGLGRARPRLHRLWDDPLGSAAFLFWMGPVQGLTAALFDTLALAIAEGLPAARFGQTLFASAVGHACAALMAVPMLHMLWLRRGRAGTAPPQAPAEVAGVFVAAGILWTLVFLAPGIPALFRLGLMGLLLLPAIWAMFRLGALVTNVLMALVFMLVMLATVAGLGPFASAPVEQAATGIELLGITMACSILLGGALQAQRLRAMDTLRRVNVELDRRAEERAQALLQQEHSFRAMIEGLPAPAIVAEHDGSRVVYANPAACELFGCEDGALVGHSAADCWVDTQAAAQLQADVRAHGAVRNREMALRTFDGRVVWVLSSVLESRIDGRPVCLFAFKDISERLERERALQAQANTDALTGANNRRHFTLHGAQALSRAGRAGQSVALLLFDLDHFKQINDTWGHDCGDLVLQHSARWLRSQMRAGDLFARLGGEEFAMLLPATDARQAALHGDMLRMGLDGRTLHMPDGRMLRQPSASIGVSVAQPAADVDADGLLAALLRAADEALYEAKARGRNRVVLAPQPVQAEAAAPAASAAAAGMVAPAGGGELLSMHLLRELAREVHLGRFFERAAYAAAHLVGADGAAFIEVDGDALQYRFFEGLPPGGDVSLARMRVPADRGSAARALRERRVVYNPDYPGSADALPEFVAGGLRANLIVPLAGGGGVLALAWFGRAPQTPPAGAQLEAAGLLADLLAAAVQREALERELRRHATCDALTGLPNRAGLELHLAQALARARRGGAPLALSLLGLDDFAAINAAGGQPCGDAVLIEVARRLQGALRQSDFVTRLGGDEFAVVLEDCGNDDDLARTLERLRGAVGAPVRLPDGTSRELRFSLGLVRHPQDADEADALLRLAAAALQAAKSAKLGGAVARLEG